ncbi:acyltransferase [Mannheimia bovis]|uniref:acyltransferase n=1 Tax=Mannheimia bovis TaxID=2770636 RepID=UPI0024B6A0F8|nr:acyltransferase [Mannheimia bovis]WHP47495.1 acyltransferase [Mannheimia bovis]
MISNQGKNNFIRLPESCSGRGSKITIIGNDNSVILGENCILNNINIRLKGNNIHLKVGNNVEMTGVIASLFMNTSLFIGDNSTLGNGEITIAEENNIHIGKDCMFANGYEIRTSDMHPIYSLKNGERINFGANIYIGNHIWLGRDVVILKGVTLADNIMVGIRSVVTKSFEQPNSVLAGTPAKLLSQNVIWGRKMYHKTMFDDSTLKEYYENFRENNDNQ